MPDVKPSTDFKSLALAPQLHKALEKLGYTTPTPIQEKAIPDVLKGKDLMGIAQTGTGKTAAFALPTLSHICNHAKEAPKRGARCLVLAPTRELASQIAVSFRDYGREIEHLSVMTVFGGVPISRQIKKLVGGNDILVATPGRLIDLLDRKAITLKDVEVLILDEADQMMDMGFIHALKKIVPQVPKKRQTLFFSATMVPAIKKLAGQFLTDPVTVSVTPPNSTAERVTQQVILVNQAEKQGLLSLSLLEEDVNRALVFTRTKHGADRVVKRLAQVGILAVAIHGNKSQGQRQRALQAFRDGDVTVLVATDIAARGIDIEGITHVINYEIPNVPEQYVHRIGRTARANREGKAIAFVSKDERKYLKDIQKLLKTEIPIVPLPEDFLKKVGQLKSRKALPAPPKQKPDPRKGRGKSKKKKARFSKDKNKKSRETNAQDNSSKENNAPKDLSERKSHRKGPKAEASFEKSSDYSGKNKKKNKPSAKSWRENEKPRSRVKPKKGKPQNGGGADETSPKIPNRPKNQDGESRAERKARNQAKHAKEHSRRKPREGGNVKDQTRSKNNPNSSKPSEPKKPHQRYGKKTGNRKARSGSNQNSNNNSSRRRDS